MRHLKNIKLLLNYVVGPLLIPLLGYSIYQKLFSKPFSGQAFLELYQGLNGTSILQLLLLLLFMMLNWGLEAWKWKISMALYKPVSYSEAFKGVLAGTSFGFFTPNRVGEYVGRVVVLQPGNRATSLSLTLVCSIAQLLVTLFAGLAGLFFLNRSRLFLSSGFQLTGHILLYASLTAIIFLLLSYVSMRKWSGWLNGKSWFSRLSPYAKALESLQTKMLFQVLFLSILRYIVFIIQYGLAFSIFKISLSPEQLFGSVSVVFLVVALVPSLAQLFELGVRWEASMEIVVLFTPNLAAVFSASFTIWVVNLVFPALVGMFFLWKIRVFKNT
jgi:hypothetical protein